MGDIELLKMAYDWCKKLKKKTGVDFIEKSNLLKSTQHGCDLDLLLITISLYKTNKHKFLSNPLENYINDPDENVSIRDLWEDVHNLSNESMKCLNAIPSKYVFPTKETQEKIQNKAIKTIIINKYNKTLNRLKKQSGVYILYNKNNQLIYVGQSKNLKKRIPESCSYQEAYSLDYYVIQEDIIHDVEACLINRFRPENNKVFPSSYNKSIMEDLHIFDKGLGIVYPWAIYERPTWEETMEQMGAIMFILNGREREEEV